MNTACSLKNVYIISVFYQKLFPKLLPEGVRTSERMCART
jgi:hypothetical protein